MSVGTSFARVGVNFFINSNQGAGLTKGFFNF